MIIIKELFESDLDANDATFFSSKKLDKINYNFNQILVEGGGPIGPNGIDGGPGGVGLSGIIGDTGIVGEDGPQGDTGPDGLNEWRELKDTSSTIFPKEVNAIVRKVKIGINSVLSEYSTESMTGVENSLKVHKFNSTIGESNEHLNSMLFSANDDIVQSSTDLFGYNFLRYNLKDYLQLGSLDYGNALLDLDLLIECDTFKFNGIDGETREIGETSIFKNLNIDGTGTTRFSNVKMLPGNGVTDKVLTATDNIGTISWVNDNYNKFPIGTIIPVASNFVYNSTNFEIDGSYSYVSSDSTTWNFMHGRGKQDGPWRGWYLCNGKIWETVDSTIQYTSPNLVRFEYDIDEGLGALTSGDDTRVFIGGADISISASYGTNSYSLTETDSTTKRESSIGNTSITHHNDFDGVNEVYLVYLGSTDLVWKTSTGAAATLHNVNLKYHPTDPTLVCSAPSQVYQVTTEIPDVAYWEDYTNFGISSGDNTYSLTLSGNSVVAGGYYMIHGGTKVRLFTTTADGTGFSPVTASTCISNTADFIYDQDVDGGNLNGYFAAYYNPPEDVIGYVFNSATFETSTLFYQSNGSTLAPQGWYRRRTTPKANTMRRYWNGTSFEGSFIKKDYVAVLSNQFGAYNGIMCDAPSVNGVFASHPIFVASNGNLNNSTSIIGQVNQSASNTSQIYIHNNGIHSNPTVDGRHALVPITGSYSNMEDGIHGCNINFTGSPINPITILDDCIDFE